MRRSRKPVDYIKSSMYDNEHVGIDKAVIDISRNILTAVEVFHEKVITPCITVRMLSLD